VCSFAVEYIWWNAYGSSVHIDVVGWNSGCAKPFATLAVIEADSPVVVSVMAVTSPAVESWMETLISSPGFMKSASGPGLPDCMGSKFEDQEDPARRPTS
jgi:hypothetical protein